MKFGKYVILLEVIILNVPVSLLFNNNNRNDNILLLQTLIRHGDRTPVHLYPTDPYLDASFWPEGLGQVTTVGHSNMYSTGLFFREYYSPFLNRSFHDSEVYVRSSDLQRTLSSAQSFLAAIYTPKKEQMWMEGLHWQPVPVHTVPFSDDKLMNNDYPCRTYMIERELIQRSGDFDRLMKESQNLRKFLDDASKLPIMTDPSLIIGLYQIERGHVLPSWTSSVYPEPIKYYYLKFYNLMTYTQKMQKIKSGSILNAMVKNIQTVVGTEKENENSNLRFSVFSGHDYQIVSFLKLLKVYELQDLPSCASVTLELRELEDGFGVQVMYKAGVNFPPQVFHLPDCYYRAVCPLERFLNITHNLRVENLDAECQIK